MPSRAPSRAGRRARTSSAFPCPPPWGRACASKWSPSRPDRPERQTKGFPAVLLRHLGGGGRECDGGASCLPTCLVSVDRRVGKDVVITCILPCLSFS